MNQDAPTSATNDPERWLQLRWFALGLGLLLILRFHGIFLGTEAFTLRDFSMFGYPIAAHLQNSLFAGELPLWNPLSHAGTPFLAQWNTMVLYPPMLVTALLPLTWSLSVFCILHQFLGGLGAWCLAHRFTGDRWGAALASFAFVGNGLVQSSLMWPNNIAALAWMPWLILLAERATRERGRIILGAALVGGLQMLTGGPEIILLTWLLIGGLVATQAWHHKATGREAAKRFGTVGGLAALTAALAAAQLLPFLDLLAQSHRGAGYADGEWALSAMAWAKFFAPLFNAIEAPGKIYYDSTQSWTHSIYAGLPVLALAFVAPFIRQDKRLWVAAVAAFLCLLVSMGHQGWIYPWLAQIPPFNFLRFPVKFIIPLTLILPVLAAIGFAHIRRWDNSPNSDCCGKRMSILFSVMFAGWVAAFAMGWGNDRIEQSDWITNSSARLPGLLIVIGALAILVRRASNPPLLASAITLIAVTVDLQIHQPNLAPTVPAQLYGTSTPSLESLREQLEPPQRAALSANAMLNLNANSLPSLADTQLLRRTAQFGNANLIDQIPNVEGFFSMHLAHYRDVQSIFHVGENAIRRNLADFLGVSHVMYQTNMFHWLPRPGPMPLITGGQALRLVSATDSLEQLAAEGFDPRKEVLLEADSAGDISAQPGSVIFEDLKIKPHRIECRATSSEPAIAVIAQAFHPAWQAEVNGQPAKLLLANHAFQAVAIPAGNSSILISYQDRRFQAGCWISLLTLAACIFGLIRRPVRSCNP